MRVYDPCSGSGGMLIPSQEYVDEHGGNARNLGLYGQEDERRHVVDLEDEHAPARHPRRGHPERRHAREPACTAKAAS